METAKLVEAIVHESEQVQSGIERTQNGIFTSFGVVLPAILGVFLFVGEGNNVRIPPPLVAAILIVVVSLGGLWSQYLWMELFRYTRYKHVHLLPRLYAATGQSDHPNMMQLYGRRSLLMALPINLFNAGVLVVLIAAHFALVKTTTLDGRFDLLPYLTGAFILAVISSSIAVILEGARLERSFRSAGTNAAGLPPN